MDLISLINSGANNVNAHGEITSPGLSEMLKAMDRFDKYLESIPDGEDLDLEKTENEMISTGLHPEVSLRLLSLCFPISEDVFKTWVKIAYSFYNRDCAKKYIEEHFNVGLEQLTSEQALSFLRSKGFKDEL